MKYEVEDKPLIDNSIDKVVPVLITWDVDPFPEVTYEEKVKAFGLTQQVLGDLEIKSTFFCPARMARFYKTQVEALVRSGHEIACHGLHHEDDEEYNRMPETKQRACLLEATDILQEISGTAMSSFRGPRAKTSHITQKILEDLGYCADSSVSSQRIDLVSSNLINLGWIYAPRLPYHPRNTSAFRRGTRNIWVVPISALSLPFISSALYVLRLRFMKIFFYSLYLESCRTGKPIVYLAHPFEFAPEGQIERIPFSFTRFRTHGFLLREKFYIKDHTKKFQMNRDLFTYMKSFPRVKFMTMKEYVSEILNSVGEKTNGE